MRLVALVAALGAGGCGAPCESVLPSRVLPYLGSLSLGLDDDVGLRAFRSAHLERSGAVLPLVGADPVVVRVLLPRNHCAGEVSVRVAQVVGPADPPADQVLALVSGTDATRDVIGTSDALRRSDDGVSFDTFSETGREKRLGPSATDHVLSFAVAEGVDVLTLVRTSAEVRESVVLGASFSTPRPGADDIFGG